ncbi:MAG: tetratricopeptide repeat protein [Microbacterium sp.]|uniref:tetratricopeptide repeat protein n=1 Tax=Microbacterium sp. TaxID=51671 RepID=UPI001DDB8B7D|nr:tetratricopeptide repeat protein [Microbacterium sp.]MBW8761479.1 tetratricopeptide repeat protein [Microbacterium sp.]
MTHHDDRDNLEQVAIVRDRDLALELLGAQPTNRRIATLAHSVLAREPRFTGTYLILALHHQARGELDDARRELRQLIGFQDGYRLTAVRILRDLEYENRRFDEALRLAEHAMQGGEEVEWLDLMMLGAATVFTGSRTDGWDLMDEAVVWTGRVDPTLIPKVLAKRALLFLSTGAPPERFLPAAEAAIAASPWERLLSIALAYAYLYDYRAADARDLFQRVLREDPTDTVAQGGMIMARGFLEPIERGDATMDQLREAGMGEMAWRIMHEQIFDLDIEHALAALSRVLPRALVRALRGPLRRKKLEATEGNRSLLGWHDGQDPGTGDAWGLGEPVRLLSGAEVDAMAAAAQDPGAWPTWSEDDAFVPIATDDAGSYFFEGYASRLYRRTVGGPDVEVAPSLADWVWDRVVDFGGEEPRPGRAPRG